MIYILFFLFFSCFVFIVYDFLPKNLILVVICLFFALFAALREINVAADLLVYQDWYTNRDEGSGYLERPGYFEALYFLLNDTFSKIGINFRVFVGFLAFLAVLIKVNVLMSFAKSAWAAAASVLIYSLTFYLLHEFTQIRAGLAVAFIFLALLALVYQKRLLFLLFILTAAGFHSSAVVAFILFLPCCSTRTRWIDWGLCSILGVLYLLFGAGISLGVVLLDWLSSFDPRVALYISMAESGKSLAANPLSASALLLLILTLSLMRAEVDPELLSTMNKHEMKALVLTRRSCLVGLIFLTSFSHIPELALRLFEINIALVPVLAVIVFSQQSLFLQKLLLLLWTATVSAIYIGREEGLVQPYVLFFS